MNFEMIMLAASGLMMVGYAVSAIFSMIKDHKEDIKKFGMGN